MKRRSPGVQARASDVNTLEKDHVKDSNTAVSVVIPFKFEAREVRTLLVDREPWFFAVDVCAALALSDTNKALIGLDDDEKREHEQYSGSGRKPVLINESGLYSLILRSRKAEAKRFKKWLTSEVLPAIRKHGRYEDAGNKMATLVGDVIGTTGELVLDRVIDQKGGIIPAGLRRSFKHTMKSRLRSRFNVQKTALIPASELANACNFVAAYALEGEWIGQSTGEGLLLTEAQAINLSMLLHSVAWVGHRWHQGIGAGVRHLNQHLWAGTFEHVDNMARWARFLDRDLLPELKKAEERQRPGGLGGLRPAECVARGIAA